MEIIISSKREAQEWLRSISKGRDIQYVISITDPGEKPPRGFANHPAEKLSISFVDVEEDGGGYKAPRNADVMRIVKFCEKIVANPGKRSFTATQGFPGPQQQHTRYSACSGVLARKKKPSTRS